MKKKTRAPLRMIRIKLAKKGGKVPNPSTGRSIPEGEVVEVPDAPYWHRRLRDGVVALADEEKKAPEKTSETKTPEKTSETKTETKK